MSDLARSTEPCLVKPEDARPAGKPDECFYCNQPMGHLHKPDCVIPQRTVMIRMTIEFPRSVPRSWEKDMIEFQLNDGSWCADNILSDLEKVAEDNGCLCSLASFEYIGEVTPNA